MNKWYQGIIVEHKELDNKMYHCFDDENFEKLTNERNEQLKEIERLQKDLTYYQKYSADLLNKNNTFESIIKEVREYIEKHKHLNWYNDSCYMNDLLEILDKVD